MLRASGNGNRREGESADEDDAKSNKCKELGGYFVRKAGETLGLQLTPVQQVYWRAAQRRMVMTQLEDMILSGKSSSSTGSESDVNKLVNEPIQELPYNLYKALVNGDPGNREYILSICDRNHIRIVLDSEEARELEEVDGSPDRQPLQGDGDMDGYGVEEPDTDTTPALDPRAALAKCKKCADYTHDEEEDFQDKGSFWSHAIFASKFLWKKCSKKRRDQATITLEGNYGNLNTQVEGVSHTPNEETDGGMSEDGSDSDYSDIFFGRDRLHTEAIQLVDDEDVDGAGFFGTTKKRKFLSGPKAKALRKNWQFINRFVPFRIINFQLAHLTPERQEKLNRLWSKAARWPLFTWWLLFVHLVIMIVTLSVYGFAPLKYSPFTERALVQQSSLAVLIAEKSITPNIWAGPSQDALVLLGANYAPCMRRDKLVFAALDAEREREANMSGCCVRRDTSGCVQVPSSADCPEKFADFVFNDTSSLLNTSLYSNRAVCGTSPRTCESPTPAANRGWESDSISDWPICVNSMSPPSSASNEHLTCTLTGRPCCTGLLGSCTITTQEHCDFLDGVFHDNAFLCSQVNCLTDICGLVPFARADYPDQITRVVLSLFLHAGIFHLLITMVFNIYVVRDIEKYLGWLSTAILYIGSGLGGNIVSALFVPYSPEVGPSASLFGVIAFFSVFIMYHYRYMKHPFIEVIKYLLFIAIFVVVGLLPYVDNYARLGGFIFGLLFSFIHVHYIPQYDAMIEFKKFKASLNPSPEGRCAYCIRVYDVPLIVKMVLLCVGIIGLIPLFVFSFIWFYVEQVTSEKLTYFNCIIPTSISDLCSAYRQTI